MLLPFVGLLVAGYVVSLFVFPPAPDAVAQSTAGAELYVDKCAGCHQSGGVGVPGAFPPLAGNGAATDAEYVRSVIVEGTSGPITVLGETYDQAMPAVSGLSDEEVDLVTAYVVELATGAAEPGGAVRVVEVGDGDADRGHDLFRGAIRFGRGGAACASCHVAGDVGNLGGWSLGPDLTDVHERFGGDAGTAAWLANPSSATMRPLFADRALADDEIAHLVAFLADAPDRDEPAGAPDRLAIAGLAVVATLLGAMAIARRGRKRPYAQTLEPRRAR